MGRDEQLTRDEVGRILDSLRGRGDPLIARRFACACVRSVWDKVTVQEHVAAELISQCRRAVELTERSLFTTVRNQELNEIDFTAITDAGNNAFMAAAHVGWNLFAALNGLHQVDEFENARQVAFLAACAGGTSEAQRQMLLLRELVGDPSGGDAA